MQKLAENGNVDQLRKLLLKRMEFGTAGHFLLKKTQRFECFSCTFIIYYKNIIYLQFNMASFFFTSSYHSEKVKNMQLQLMKNGSLYKCCSKTQLTSI